MTQRQQVNAEVDGQHRMEHGQRRSLYQAIEPEAEEAHVVPAADIVDARLPHPGQIFPGGIRTPAEQAGRREQTNPGGRGAGGRCGVRHISTLGPVSSAPQSREIRAACPVVRG